MKIEIEERELLSERQLALVKSHIESIEEKLKESFISFSVLMCSQIDEINMIAHPFEDDVSKQATALFLRQEANRMAADTYLMATECWKVEGDDLEHYQQLCKEGKCSCLAEYERRKDAVCIILETIKGQWMATEIVGKPIEKLYFQKSVSVSGLFANIINNPSL